MATKDQIIAFLQLWYSGEVNSIEDFRKHDATCKATPGFKEGDKSTYPTGYDNGSLNQKAHRYVCRKDHNGLSWEDRNWTEPFNGSVKRDDKGNLVLNKSNKPITRRLSSTTSARGKVAASWAKDDFKGFKATTW